MSVHDDYDTDNAPSWLTDDVPVADPDERPTWAPPDAPAPATIEVQDLIAEPRAAFDLETIRAAAPPVVRRAIDRLVRGAFSPDAAVELRELVDALKVPGLEVVIDRGIAEWERRHPPKARANGNGKRGHRDAKPDNVPPAEPVDVLAGSSWDDVAAAIHRWGQLPTTPIYVPTYAHDGGRGAQELFRLKPGGIIVLIGGSGAGKTSLALEMAACHAQWSGPVGVFSLELSLAEAGARRAGQDRGLGWLAAAEMSIDELKAIGSPRMHVFERMGIAAVEARVAALVARYPGQQILIVVDYAQILEDDVTERLQFAAVLERLRLMIKRHEVIAILTSQSSRSGAQALRKGEKTGADTTDTGAESAQLERMAYVTLALGNLGEDDGRGWQTVDLNIGKARMGEGDVIVPMAVHGKSGRFAYLGAPQRASDVREERVQRRKDEEQKRNDERDEQRVIEVLKGLETPLARRAVEDRAGGNSRQVRRALARLIATGQVLEVGSGARAGWLPPVILASNAAQCGPMRPSTRPSDGPHSPAQCGHGPYVVGPGRVGEAGEGTHSDPQMDAFEVAALE